MLQATLTQYKPIACYRHKKQIATHLCIDTKCNNNPILCAQCLSQGHSRTYHYDHQKSILPFSQAVEALCDTIKNQSGPIQRIYKATFGRGDLTTIVAQLEKGPMILQQLQDRIATIKSQVELEIQLLIKQIQKVLLLEKQEYFKMLQNYQKAFTKNVQFIRLQSQPIMDFQNSLKYYSNRNNFYLKMVSQINRKSDWIMRTKKILQTTTKNVQNSNITNQINNILNMSNKIKLDIWPQWKGQDTLQKSNQFKFVIKRAINQWIYIPQLKSLQEQMQNIPQNPSTGSHLGLMKNYYVQSNGK